MVIYTKAFEIFTRFGRNIAVSSKVNNIDYNLTRHYLNDLIMHISAISLRNTYHNKTFTFLGQYFTDQKKVIIYSSNISFSDY